MDNLIVTLGIAFVLVAFAIAALAIGWLLTGKSRLKRSCGQFPSDIVKNSKDKDGHS